MNDVDRNHSYGDVKRSRGGREGVENGKESVQKGLNECIYARRMFGLEDMLVSSFKLVAVMVEGGVYLYDLELRSTSTYTKFSPFPGRSLFLCNFVYVFNRMGS